VHSLPHRALCAQQPGKLFSFLRASHYIPLSFQERKVIELFKDVPLSKYNQIIRPWKSRLGLLYVEKCSFWLDLQIIGLTIIAILSRPMALRGVQRILKMLRADKMLSDVARRKEPLKPYPPPGADQIVKSR